MDYLDKQPTNNKLVKPAVAPECAANYSLIVRCVSGTSLAVPSFERRALGKRVIEQGCLNVCMFCGVHFLILS